jgi:putative ABC transport system permease protein
MSNGWRPALRMARREIRRAPGRSLFTWLMIFVPVTAICAIQVVLASNALSDTEWLDLKLGSAQAVLTQTGSAFEPSYSNPGQTLYGGDQEGESGTGEGSTAKPVPGWGTSVEQQRDATAALLNRTVVALTLSTLVRGDSGRQLDILGADFSDLKAAGFVHDLRGQPPRDTTQALVSPSGLAAGIPSSGTVTLTRSDGTPTTVTIVGTAQAQFDGPVQLISVPETKPDRVLFYVFGGAPLGWDEAVRLAGYGFQVTSRELNAHPPKDWSPGNSAQVQLFFGTLITMAALLEVALVVGPAFAIGAAHQRRSLALAAANGATTSQLRKAAVGQAVLLGVSAAALGTAVGSGVGALAYPMVATDPNQTHGPLEFPLLQLGLLLGLGTLTAIVSALVTSRGLGRLDLVSALRGSVRPAPPRRGAPIVGGLMVGAGLAGVWLAIKLPDAVYPWAWTASALAVLVGSILAVPWLLRLASRFSGRTPISVRMALRDTARQHGRATSTVAAVLAGSLILAAVWTMYASGNANSARRYHPTLPLGQATLQLADQASPESLAAAKAAALGVEPGMRVSVLSELNGSPDEADGTSDRGFIALRTGCTAEQAATPDTPSECTSLGGGWYGDGILAGSVDDLTTAFSLDPGQRAAVEAGKLLAVTEAPPDATATGITSDQWARTDIVDGRVRFIAGAEPSKVYSVPAQALPSSVLERGAVRTRYGAIISADAAKKLGWRTSYTWLQLADPSGPISADQEKRLNTALAAWMEDPDASWAGIQVERGFQPGDETLLFGVTATLILLLLVAAVTATVLSTNELRPYLATFAAVGASPGLSRRLSAVQGTLLAGIGCVLGVAIGSFVAGPLAAVSTAEVQSNSPLPPLIAFPWLLIAALVVATPAVAGATAALCTPSRTTLAKRS